MSWGHHDPIFYRILARIIEIITTVVENQLASLSFDKLLTSFILLPFWSNPCWKNACSSQIVENSDDMINDNHYRLQRWFGLLFMPVLAAVPAASTWTFLRTMVSLILLVCSKIFISREVTVKLCREPISGRWPHMWHFNSQHRTHCPWLFGGVGSTVPQHQQQLFTVISRVLWETWLKLSAFLLMVNSTWLFDKLFDCHVLFLWPS